MTTTTTDRLDLLGLLIANLSHQRGPLVCLSARELAEAVGISPLDILYRAAQITHGWLLEGELFQNFDMLETRIAMGGHLIAWEYVELEVLRTNCDEKLVNLLLQEK